MGFKPESEIDRLQRHCRMFFFGCSPGFLSSSSDVAEDFVNFALIHLACTMFITRDKKTDTRGGFFYRILSSIGQAHLLKPIEDALNMKVGNTTLCEYFRNKRNKMTVHGDLSFDSQSKAVKDVTFSEEAIAEFYEAMSTLESRVSQLYKGLINIESDLSNGLKA